MLKIRWLIALLVAIAVLPASTLAQAGGAIQGRVTATGSQQPITGAQVRVEGTTSVAVTDVQGRFQLQNVPSGARTLQVTALGHRAGSARVTVGATPAEVEIQLQPDALGLDELVVVGYGEARRRTVSGAVSSLRSEAVADLPTVSVNNVLQGRLAGVQVTQNSGAPGSAITVRVRGSSSISAGNQPLYVIDGVPMVQGNYNRQNSTFGGQGVDALSDLNPNEIESIEVLKDASAAAIYGARASNGVVLITTKRGSAGRAEINFGGYYGTQQDWRRVQFLNTDQYIVIKNEGIFNRYGIEDYYGFADDGVDNYVEVQRGVDTDWVDQVMRTAPIYNFDGSIRGGSERVRYYVSGSTFDQQGIVHGFAYQRLNGRVNLDYVPTDRMTLGTNVSLARGVVDRQRGDNTIYGPFANAIANPPVQPVFNDDGTYFETSYVNPVGLYRENEFEERSIRVLGNTFLRYEISEGLNVRGSVGLDQYNLRSRSYESPVIGVYAGSGGAGTAGSAYATKATYEGTLNFSRLFGSRHDVSGVVGASYEDNTENFSSVSGQAFPSNAFRYLTSAALINAGTDSVSSWGLQSYFGRLSYTLDDRITTTFNVRTDGSSRFGANQRWGVFPSASILWRLTEEGFMQNQSLFSNLALRASYGRTGNQAGIGNFASRGLFAGGFNYADLPGIAPSQLGNPDLRWETTDQFNIGTDFSVLDDRVSFGLDYYIKKTDDLLVARPIPRTTGFASIWSNVGSVENRGVELTSRVQWMRGGTDGFNWSTDFNLSRNRNKVTELLNDEPMSFGFASRVEVGHPIGAFYGHRTEGLFQDASEICRDSRGGTHCAGKHAYQASGTAPGDIRFRDIDGNGVINDDDRTIIGSPWPDFEGGLTNTLSYRGVDLTVFAQYSYGNDILNANRFYSDDFGSYDDNHTARALNRWTPETPNASEPRAVYGDPNRNTRASDRFIEDGSYLRLKNVVLGYTLPDRMTSRTGFRNVRVYLQGQNLLTFTDYSGFDPEVNYAGASSVTRGTDFYTLPQARTLTFGFNLGL